MSERRYRIVTVRTVEVTYETDANSFSDVLGQFLCDWEYICTEEVDEQVLSISILPEGV